MKMDDTYLETFARDLALSPINSGSYGSEAPYLRRLANSLGAKEQAGTAAIDLQIEALECLSRRYATDVGLRGKALFTKNLSLLCDDIYLQSCLFPDLQNHRLSLAELRARLSILALEKQDKSAPRRERFFPGTSSSLRFLRKILAALFPVEMKQALSKALDFIDPQNLASPAFPSVIKRWARCSECRSQLVAFRRSLAEAILEIKSAFKQPDVWSQALQCCDRDPERALEMMGGIISQRKGPLRYIEREQLRSKTGGLEVREAFVEAAKSFFMLGVLHERSRHHYGQSLLYPPETDSSSPKFWHFYGSALVASRLSYFTEPAVRRVSLLVGTAYELFTMPFNVRLLSPHGVGHALRKSVEDLIRDVRLHLAGSQFGWRMGGI